MTNEEFLAQLRLCLDETKANLQYALDRVTEVRKELAAGLVPSADGEFALLSALRRETVARCALDDMQRVYHLATGGRP